MKTILLALLVGILGCGKSEFQVQITPLEIQQMIQPRFPIETTVLVANLKLHSPTVSLKGNRVSVRVHYLGTILGNQFKGSIDVDGTPAFRKTSQAFFFEDLKVAHLDMPSIAFLDPEKVKSTIEPYLTNHLNVHPIFRLDPQNYKHNLARMFLKRMEVHPERIVVTFGP